MILELHVMLSLSGFLFIALFRWHAIYIFKIDVNNRNLFNLNNSFVKKFCMEYSENAFKLSFLIMKITPFAITFIWVFVSMLSIMTVYFIEPMCFPLPFFIHLPFVPATNSKTWILNMIHLELGALTTTMMCFIPFVAALLTYIYICIGFDAVAKLIFELIYIRKHSSIELWIQLIQDILLTIKE